MAPTTEEIAKLKHEREQIRRLITRSISNTKNHIEQNEHGAAIVEFTYLDEKFNRLNTIDTTIQSSMLDNYIEEDFTIELDLAEDFKKQYFAIKHAIDVIKTTKFAMKTDCKSTTTATSAVQNLNLPKLELRKFDDDPKNWLAFWNQYKKIHEAVHLQEEDKFQYLLQSLKEGSSAKSMAESFPPSANNYSKVIEQLKARFAREDVLIQIYIREIIKLILEQKHSHLNLSVLYDKLTSSLLCLESLGVTKSKYEIILYPLVESALPESVLVAWNRSLKPKQLTPLLEFFNREIESGESIKMARSNFLNLRLSSSNDPKRLLNTESSIPTAACIVSNVRADKSGKDSDIHNCCLCGKSNHLIFQCNKANTMSLDKKKEAIKKSKCCYICLRRGHMANKCKAFVKCIVCQNRHNVILCPTVHNKENTMLVRTNETLLQTVAVNITYNNTTKRVRALVDSGAQRSYVKSSVVKALEMKESGTESIGQTLFGGISRPTKVHKCYELQSMTRAATKCLCCGRRDVQNLERTMKLQGRDWIVLQENYYKKSKEIMQEAKFDLRGWITAPEKNTMEEVPVLGMTWNTERDTICCNTPKENRIPIKITKRYILSVAQQAFDPLGIISAITIVPKQILQRVWEKKYSWDAEISEELAKEFKQWFSTIHLLKACKIPRRLSRSPLEKSDVTLHVCCDASEKAFAACIYLRTQHNNKVDVQIVIAKSRVSPAGKKMSLPRLELMSAVIASRLYKEVINSGLLDGCDKYKTYFWTDSAVTLAWLKQRNTWKPFVSNRVKEIAENTNINDWHHIPGHLNPADLPSRGCNAKKLIESRWLEGPTWMKQPEKDLPISKPIVSEESERIIRAEEKLQTAANLNVVSPSFSSRLMYFSKYNRIVRVIAWILRTSSKRRKEVNLQKDISNDEYMYAERSLQRLVQQEYFTEQTLPENINTKVDEIGLIRVNTRLDLCHETAAFVNPILLPGKHEIVQRLVEQTHEKLKHAGTTTLLSNLRDTYWILNARWLVKKTVAKCVICKKQKSKHYRIPEAPLPIDRIENKTVFQTTGIDLAGPLYLRDRSKCWIVLFTCATYRAVHLEIVESIATATFLMALRRLIARRGRICTIYTDQGTNFQGAANLLKEVNWTELQAETATSAQPIKWKFLPPASPWWGGWWERLIRVVKEMLRRILGKAAVTYIELSTLLCEVEAVVNSRPLTYVTADDDALRPLTPMMFLHTLPTTQTPDLDQIDAKGLNVRLQYMGKLREDFRQRFKKEYLSLLLSRNKCNPDFPAVGDIVLVETESSRLQWPLGIIKELVSGADGLTRVAIVKTATGERTRACQRLYPLELSAASKEWLRSTTDEGNGEPEKIDLHSHSNCDLEAGVTRSSDETPQQQVSSESQPSTASTRLGRVVKIPRRFLD